MKENESPLAIVGFGARGLHVLEVYFNSLSRKRNSYFSMATIFEPRLTLGSGLAWNSHQSPIAVSNISDRALEPLKGRNAFEINGVLIEDFPAYLDWLEDRKEIVLNEEVDSFSSRSTVGEYLEERAKTILEPLISNNLVTVIHDKVVAIKKDESCFSLTTGDGVTRICHHVILALGHTNTISSEENWIYSKHAVKNKIQFIEEPYNTSLEKAFNSCDTCAIKGFGLAMIDVVQFAINGDRTTYKLVENSVYLKYEGRSPLKLIPYSINGLPPVPKPIGKQIDDHFDPWNFGAQNVIDQLFKEIEEDQIETLDDILEPIARLTMKVYQGQSKVYSNEPLTMEDGIELLLDWYRNHEIQHPHLLDTGMETVEYMKITCEMSHGLRPFSLDYTAGQVWRYLQIEMYRIYSHKFLSRQLISEYIEVNEIAKRYSFGPPVQSILQLIALVNAQVIDLNFIRNPEINLEPNGFKLLNSSTTLDTKCLINAVLEKPDLARMSDPLLNSLVQQDLIEPFRAGLGIAVNGFGNPIVNGKEINSLFIIGRNARGSEFGVDSILECFNTSLTKKMMDRIVLDLELCEIEG